MAVSELQTRLDYLVSYASQLIFINGESIDQSSVLDTFISDSPEQIDIALLTASPTTPLSKYREKIYRQLVSQTRAADFNRPLNQLLAALNQHDGSLIISISRAENLPDKLLQELWELVLQSRFANNKQLLNVLLFAQGPWAKQARNKLHSRSGDKPLLLSDFTALPKLNQHSSKLDTLIAQKRQQFSERVKKRAEMQKPAPAFLQKKAVIASFVGIFLLLFGGIVSLQYPLWNVSSSLEPESDMVNQASVTPASVKTQSDSEQSLTSDDASTQQEAVVAALPASNQASATPTDEILSTATTRAPADLLVTDWRSAVAKIDDKPSQYLLPSPKAATIEQAPAQPQQAATESPKTEDIVANTNTAPTNTAPAKNTAELVSNTHANKPQAAASDTLQLRNGEYLIQISAMSDTYLLQQFMQQNPFSGQVWNYTTQRFGADWHVIVYKHYYASLAEARSALAQLPPELAHYQPFVKSARQIKQEIAQKGA